METKGRFFDNPEISRLEKDEHNVACAVVNWNLEKE